MADVRYSVEVEFLQKGGLGKGLGLGSAMSSLGEQTSRAGDAAARKWETSFNKTFGSMSGSLQSITGMLAADTILGGLETAAQGVFKAIKFGVVEMNAEIEEMKIGLGTIFTANGVTDDLTAGMDKAGGMLAQMRKDAAVLPGEFKELASIFQTILAPGLNKGMNTKQIQDMATHAMAYGTSIGLRAPVIGRELAAMLSGQARGQNILAQRLPGMQLHGEEAKKFNALPDDKLVAKLQTSLGMKGGQEAKAYDQALVAYGKSWIGITSSLKDNFKLFAMTATEPLFEKLKAAFGWLNDWFSANGAKVHRWAVNVGQAIEHGFDRAFGIAKKMMPFFEKAGGLFSKHREEGRLGRDAAIVGGGAVGLATMAAIGPGVMETVGSLSVSLIKLGAAAPEVAAAGVVALAAAMVPLSVISVAVAGAFEAVTDSLSYAHHEASNAFRRIEEGLGSALVKIKDIWKKIEDPVTNIATIFGTTLLNALDWAVVGLNGFLVAVKALADYLEPYMQYAGLTGHKPGERTDREPPPMGHHQSMSEDMVRKMAAKPHGDTHIGKIEIKVVSNQDPNRIAKKVLEIQQQAVRNPTMTPSFMTPLYRP